MSIVVTGLGELHGSGTFSTRQIVASASVAVGDVMELDVIHYDIPATVTVADDLSAGGWALLAQVTSGHFTCSKWWKRVTVGGTPTVTLTNSSATYTLVTLKKATGLDTTATPQAWYNTDASATPATRTLPPDKHGSLVTGTIMPATLSPPTVAPGTGFTELYDVVSGDGLKIQSEYMVDTSGSPLIGGTWVFGSSATYCACMVIYAPATGGGQGPVGDLVPGLWIEADQMGLANDDPVTAADMVDLSGRGNDAVSTPASAVYKTGIINGLPVVRFDGSQEFTFPDIYPFSGMSGNATIIVVFNRGTAGEDCLVGGDSLSASYGFGVFGGTSLAFQINGAVGVNGTVASTGNVFGVLIQPYVNVYNGAGYDATIFVNGQHAGLGEAGNTISPNSPALHVGGIGDDAGSRFIGDIAAVLVYWHGVSVNRLNAIMAYYASKYALTTTPYQHGLVVLGDSISNGVDGGSPKWPAIVAGNLTACHAVSLSAAASTFEGFSRGDRMKLAMIDELLNDPGAADRVLFIQCGTNDLGIPGAYSTGLLLFNAVRAFVVAVKARCACKVIVATLLPRTLAGFNTERNDYNQRWRDDGLTAVDGLCDWGSSAVFGQDSDASDTAKYPDGTHPSTTVEASMANDWAQPAIEAVFLSAPDISYDTPQVLPKDVAISTISPTNDGGDVPDGGWTVHSGTLPTGLSLDADTGDITGTPTVAQAAADVVIRATNDTFYSDFTISFTVVAAPDISYTTPQVLTQNVAVTPISPTNAGGSVPNGGWTVNSGTLPTGLSLNANTGVITGTPTVLQSAANVVIRATNTGGHDDFTISFSVVAAPASEPAGSVPQLDCLTGRKFAGVHAGIQVGGACGTRWEESDGSVSP